ncbi:MAG: hypothetical protein HY755_10475 [Nitrospirae bacterium]|nr:hypothetical protein [Nitrospirota bacterium]
MKLQISNNFVSIGSLVFYVLIHSGVVAQDMPPMPPPVSSISPDAAIRESQPPTAPPPPPTEGHIPSRTIQLPPKEKTMTGGNVTVKEEQPAKSPAVIDLRQKKSSSGPNVSPRVITIDPSKKRKGKSGPHVIVDEKIVPVQNN